MTSPRKKLSRRPNDVLKNAVGGIAEIINEYGHVNVDFEDVRTVMGEPGKAMMGDSPRFRSRPCTHRGGASRGLPACWKASICRAPRGVLVAGDGRQGQPEAGRVAPGHVHHQRLRFARCARDLWCGLR